MPGITGLRGVAVAAVVAYHLGYLPGGFVGVDVFFVLSGFLVTSLLLGDPPVGPSGLRRWWMRRFTRLTPAAVVVVVAVLLVFATRAGVVWDGVATLTWWQNIHLIAEGTPYWSPEPSPLRHAWSLSIEEQFYAVWPLVLLGTLALARRRSAAPERAVGAVAVVAAVASFAWAAELASRTGADLSRVYFGTDTRIGTLLAGCAAAAFLHRRPVRDSRTASVARDGAAVAGIAVLVALSLAATPEERWIYTGGLLAAAIASLGPILAARGDGAVSAVLSWGPLQWLGTRSYAVYLWSWPVQVAIEVWRPDTSRALVATVTVPASLLLASVSLRWVEDPLRRSNDWARRLAPRRAAWLAGAALVVVGLVVATVSARPTVAEQVATEFERLPDPTTTVAPSTTTTACVPPPPDAPAPTWQGDTSQFERATVARAADPTRPPVCEDQVTTVLFVGDSTGRGAANGLRRLAAPDLEVWDRTDLGCGLVSTDSGCPDWRTRWARAVAEIDPEMVVVYLRTSDDLVPGPEPDFTSPEAADLRRREMAAASEVLSAGGARVVWVLPAAPLPRGRFYCDGVGEGSPCDPAWVALWREDVATVAAQGPWPTLDVQAWVDARAATADTDRPDGLHFSGGALDDHAVWLAEQLRRLRP